MTVLRRAGWIALGLLVLLWRAGWGTFPDSEWLATVIVPALPSVPPLDPLAQYSMSSPLGPFLASILRADTASSFELLHLVAVVVFALVVGFLVVRRHGWGAAALVGAAFVGSQTSVVLVAWIGSYDVFTVGLLSALVVVRDRRVAGALGLVLAFAAFEQSVFVLLALLLLAVVGIGGDRLRLAWAAGGLVVGRIVLEVWLRANDVTHGRWWFFRTLGVDRVLGMFVRGLPWFVIAGLGATLLAVVVAIVALPSRRARAAVVGVLLAALVPTALSLDQTRVFAVLTWPVVMALLVDHAGRAGPASSRRLAGWTLALAAVVPGLFVWEGRAQLATHHPWRWLARRR